MLTRRHFGAALGVGAARSGRGAPAPAPEASPAREANLARILRSKKLRVAGFAGEAPYCAKDPATGQWSGFCVAMARNLASELGVELEIVDASWQTSVVELQASRLDLSHGLNPTVKRALLVDFSGSLFVTSFAVVARNDFAPKTWAELDVPQARVAVDLGSSHEAVARRLAPNATITGFKSRQEAIAAVQSGRSDCFVATTLLALAALKENPQLGHLVTPTPPARAEVSIALPYDDDRRLRDIVNIWCDVNRANGQLRDWVVAALGAIGIDAADLPADVTF